MSGHINNSISTDIPLIMLIEIKKHILTYIIPYMIIRKTPYKTF